MEIRIVSNNKTEWFSLEKYITPVRMVVWVGARSEEVYNTICVEGVDTYQCSITFDKATGAWMLSHGQVRTECPKGLKSDRAKACSLCRGCCVNVSTANPTYSLHTPKMKTLLNGKALGKEPIALSQSDCVSFEADVPDYEAFCKSHTDMEFDDQGYVMCMNG